MFCDEFTDQLHSLRLQEVTVSDYARETAEFFANCRVKEEYASYWSRMASLSELDEKYVQLLNILQRTIGSIKQV